MFGIKKSPWIIHYDASSCNGCDIETLACLTPIFDVERLGVVNTGNPKHADIFVVTGAVNEQSKDVIRNIYAQLPEPKVVVAVGACASTGGIFRECYNVSGGVDGIIPVDVYVPGCAARPEAIIDGVVQALAVLDIKRRAFQASGGKLDEMVVLRADKNDAPELLAIQKAACQGLDSDNPETAPWQQTLEDLQNDFDRRPNREVSVLGARSGQGDPAADSDHIVFLKAVCNGKIVGVVSCYVLEDTAYLGRWVVHPFFRRHGVGRRMVEEIEKAFPGVKRFEAFAFRKTPDALRLLEKLGYREIAGESSGPANPCVRLQKERP